VKSSTFSHWSSTETLPVSSHTWVLRVKNLLWFDAQNSDCSRAQTWAQSPFFCFRFQRPRNSHYQMSSLQLLVLLIPNNIRHKKNYFQSSFTRTYFGIHHFYEGQTLALDEFQRSTCSRRGRELQGAQVGFWNGDDCFGQAKSLNSFHISVNGRCHSSLFGWFSGGKTVHPPISALITYKYDSTELTPDSTPQWIGMIATFFGSFSKYITVVTGTPSPEKKPTKCNFIERHREYRYSRIKESLSSRYVNTIRNRSY